MLRKVLVLSAAIWMAATSGYAANDSLQIKGSDTMVNLVQGWSEGYMNVKPEAFIAVTGGGSGTGFASLINGTSDIAASSREIKKQEIELAGKKGVTPVEHKVALDGIAVVVNVKNPVSKLTTDQLADIFTGKITNWKEVGGADKPIVLLSREVNSGTHVYFKEHILRHNDVSSRVEFAPSALLLPSSQAIADEIVQNDGAIGYYGIGYLNDTQKAVSVAQKEGDAYVDPTIENIVSGAYPISRPLFFYTNGEPKDNVKDFIDFVLSPEGQRMVTELDFVPIKK